MAAAPSFLGGGLNLKKPDQVNPAAVSPTAWKGNVPEPFKSEPDGGGGIRLYHKFVVIDFDKPTGRVYLGSYNLSGAADTQNGENLVIVRDRRVAVSYVVEAVRLFDPYELRFAQKDTEQAQTLLSLARPPRQPGEEPRLGEGLRQPAPRARSGTIRLTDDG